MKVKKRDILGKKNKNLRLNGMIPAVIYDKDTNISVQIPIDEFLKNYHEKGHTGIVKVELDEKIYNVLIDHVQLDPATRKPIHTTLREVNLKEEINAVVPIEYINQETSKGVKEDGGIIVTNVDEVEIIALPTHIPQQIIVDIEELKVGEGIKLEDIKLPEGVKFATDDENLLSQIIVTITHKKVEEEKPAEAAEFTPAESTKEKKEDTTTK
ncbi:MAG: 50S ribosomal protein L25 [bacterium]